MQPWAFSSLKGASCAEVHCWDLFYFNLFFPLPLNVSMTLWGLWASQCARSGQLCPASLAAGIGENGSESCPPCAQPGQAGPEERWQGVRHTAECQEGDEAKEETKRITGELDARDVASPPPHPPYYRCISSRTAIQASLPVSGNHFKYHLVAFRLFYDNAMPIERIIKLIVAEV